MKLETKLDIEDSLETLLWKIKNIESTINPLLGATKCEYSELTASKEAYNKCIEIINKQIKEL